MITILSYLLIGLLVLYFIFFLIIPIIKDYKKEKKSNWKINNIYDYYSKRSKTIPSVGNGITNIIGIIAIIIAVFTYTSSNQQSELTKESLMITKKGIDTSIVAYNRMISTLDSISGVSNNSIIAYSKMISTLDSISGASNNFVENLNSISKSISTLPLSVDSITNSIAYLNKALSEQRILAEKEYYAKIPALLKIQYTIEDMATTEIIFINEGLIDINDININVTARIYTVESNSFFEEKYNYGKIYLGNVKTNKSITFSLNSFYSNSFLKDYKHRIYNDENNQPTIDHSGFNKLYYVILIFDVSYRRASDNSMYKKRKFLILDAAYDDKDDIYFFYVSENFFPFLIYEKLFKKIELLLNSLYLED
ncbi:MAG: hypothetical protein PHN88_09265 [Ignavibacteria bacterium]|jgi:hypothetical protein|nr:hypothetical protein [Ignavibacteria bacterium]